MSINWSDGELEPDFGVLKQRSYCYTDDDKFFFIQFGNTGFFLKMYRLFHNDPLRFTICVDLWGRGVWGKRRLLFSKEIHINQTKDLIKWLQTKVDNYEICRNRV